MTLLVSTFLVASIRSGTQCSIGSSGSAKFIASNARCCCHLEQSCKEVVLHENGWIFSSQEKWSRLRSSSQEKRSSVLRSDSRLQTVFNLRKYVNGDHNVGYGSRSWCLECNRIWLILNCPFQSKPAVLCTPFATFNPFSSHCNVVSWNIVFWHWRRLIVLPSFLMTLRRLCTA